MALIGFQLGVGDGQNLGVCMHAFGQSVNPMGLANLVDETVVCGSLLWSASVGRAFPMMVVCAQSCMGMISANSVKNLSMSAPGKVGALTCGRKGLGGGMPAVQDVRRGARCQPAQGAMDAVRDPSKSFMTHVWR